MPTTKDSTNYKGEHDISTVNGFMKAYPDFFIPFIIGGIIVHAITYIPAVAEYLATNNMQPWGFQNAFSLTCWSIISQFMIHGYVSCYHDDLVKAGLKIQSNKAYDSQPGVAAIRSSMVYTSQLIYTVVPMMGFCYNFTEFAIGYAILLVWGDAYFFCCHYTFHLPRFYALFHKRHHAWKQPTSFSAYYITSWTHFIQEHICVIPALMLLPIPAESFILYEFWGTFGAQIQHSGFYLEGQKIPFTPITLNHLFFITNPLTLILGGQSTAMHDYHHENFHGNFGLSYSYLDKIFGTYIDVVPINKMRVPLITGDVENQDKQEKYTPLIVDEVVKTESEPGSEPSVITAGEV